MNEKPKEMTIEGMKKIIEASGYPLEIDIANILRERRWMVFHQFPYIEKTEKKIKLIDILAINPYIREPRVTLMIECKKSTKHGWAFHTIEKRSEVQGVITMWVDFIKKTEGYDTKIEPTDEKTLKLQLEGFHLANPETKMGTLCCIPPNHPDDFHEALQQILDALTSQSSKMPEVVFPIIVFDGPMWEFQKNNDLEIHEIKHLQFISATSEGSTQLVDVVSKSYFADFLRLLDGSVEYLKQNLVKKEVTKQDERIRL